MGAKNHGVSGLIHQIMLFNPVYFIAESYRAAILFHQWYFIDHWKLMLYNVIIILLFFIVGSILHRRYRDHFATSCKSVNQEVLLTIYHKTN